LGKIAALDQALVRRREHGTPGCTSRRTIAAGDDWTVADVLCTCSPDDRPFEEQHSECRYHFLRTFDGLVGVTPHQYVLRARLRHAAVRLVREAGSVLDVALDCGFGDISNFNQAFRTEFGVSPRVYRRER
jgi:AraC-like DNA-binding protein